MTKSRAEFIKRARRNGVSELAEGPIGVFIERALAGAKVGGGLPNTQND